MSAILSVTSSLPLSGPINGNTWKWEYVDGLVLNQKGLLIWNPRIATPRQRAGYVQCLIFLASRRLFSARLKPIHQLADMLTTVVKTIRRSCLPGFKDKSLPLILMVCASLALDLEVF